MIQFPPVEKADPDSGLIAIGGNLKVETLLEAYTHGIFPWPHDGYRISGSAAQGAGSSATGPLLWFAPPKRAVLFFEDLKIPDRLTRYFKKSNFSFKINTQFENVIHECAKTPRKKQKGTWITSEMIEAYKELYKVGHVQSFETYDASGNLVGGGYGVRIGKFFCGESMFYKVSHASKFAIIEFIKYLRGEGLGWLDIQVITPHMKMLGAKEIDRKKYSEVLKVSLHV